MTTIDTRDIETRFAQVKHVDGNGRIMDFVFNSGQQDRQDDIIPASALDSTDFRNNPVFLWAHQYEQPPIGKVLDIGADGDATIGKVLFAQTELAEDVFQLYKGGFLNAVSIGFRAQEWTPPAKGSKARTLKKGTLYEVSGVPVPADPKALRRRIKMLDVEKAESADSLLDSLRRLTLIAKAVGARLEIRFELPLEGASASRDNNTPSKSLQVDGNGELEAWLKLQKLLEVKING